ncbi:MAG TPA: hypothetical protein VL551_00290 [Actinospica sp.]|nr:hypothetical protein [Actinospica sp.]
MTMDRKRKADIRAEQQRTGRRYTQVARDTASTAEPTGGTFLLGELLAECATLPPASIDWAYDRELAPTVFKSHLIRGLVSFSTVLELAGALAQEGRGARLAVESLRSMERTVVVCNGQRRFTLALDRLDELCRKPGCDRTPINWTIVWCRDHLVECGAAALTSMASDWGYALNEDLDRDNPTRLGGNPEVDPLIKAAVACGVVEPVITTFLHACFEDPNVLDDDFYDPSVALDMRHAMDRERLRLDRVAEIEGRRIRMEAGACATCGGGFPLGVPLGVPPQFCSKDCTPPPPPVEPLVLAPLW